MLITYRAYAAPIARVLLSLIFITAGFSKITGYAGTAAYMDMMGVPGSLLPLVILTELGGGIALLIGWQAGVVAFLLAGFSVLSGLIFHFIPGLAMEGMEAQNQQIMFMKNLAIAGGLLMVTAMGAGPLSVDNRSDRMVAAQ